MLYALCNNCITIFTVQFYSRTVLAMALCLSVRLSVSVTIRSSVEMAERIELVIGMYASFHRPHTVC